MHRELHRASWKLTLIPQHEACLKGRARLCAWTWANVFLRRRLIIQGLCMRRRTESTSSLRRLNQSESGSKNPQRRHESKYAALVDIADWDDRSKPRNEGSGKERAGYSNTLIYKWSTVFTQRGKTEGAKKGWVNRSQGIRSHAIFSQAKSVGWLVSNVYVSNSPPRTAAVIYWAQDIWSLASCLMSHWLSVSLW